MKLADILPVAAETEIGFDDTCDLLLIIPTVANPPVILQTLRSLLDGAPKRTRILLSINPSSKENGDAVQQMVVDHQTAADERGIHLTFHREDGLRGFGGAINIGTRWQILNFGGLPKHIGIWNDDLICVPGSIERTIKAFDTEHVCYFGDSDDPKTGRKPVKRAEDFGPIGAVGPVTNIAAGHQGLTCDEEVAEIGILQFAANQAAEFDGEVRAAEFLSGYCMFWSRDCFLGLSIYKDKLYRGIFDAEQYPVAGYEDNDLCARMERSKWRSAIAWDAYVHHNAHQTFDSLFPEFQRGLRNRLAYMEKWYPETSRAKRICAVQRVRVSTVQDLHLWRHCMLRTSGLLDGIAVLITGNPSMIAQSAGWDQLSQTIPPLDKAMVEQCIQSGDDYAPVVEAWAKQVTNNQTPIKVERWDGEWNERDERNRAMEIAENMDLGDGETADWLMSIDHDEVIEDRVNRRILDRLVCHPDPLVSSYETGWVNHWEGGRMVRLDRPWGDAGSLSGGMTGPRLWRVNKINPRRIVHGNEKGLHCGNAPLLSFPCVKVSSVRFRHYGYVDPHQRRRKRQFYDHVDPNPDPRSIGGEDYGHITNDEAMTLRPFVAANGIGMFMLVHEKESMTDIARQLDMLYSAVDRIVLVWTDKWRKRDRKWATGDCEISDFKWKANTTGPSNELARLASMYGVEWVHKPLDHNLAEARNAGIDHLRQYMTEGMGWVLFLDPDEHLRNEYTPLRSLRSMAEVSTGWGFMIKFTNILKGGDASFSESIRMFRLDREGVMRMNGRVHEGFDRAMQILRSSGEHPNIRYAPFDMVHVGLSLDEDKLDEKLRKYRDLLVLELKDNPYAPGAWTSLGMQYINDGHEDLGLECFERGILCAGNSYLPFKEAAYWHLRRARAYMSEAVNLTVEGHPVRNAMTPMHNALSKFVPLLPKVGRESLDPIPLPEFPIPDEIMKTESDDPVEDIDPGEVLPSVSTEPRIGAK